MKIIIVFILFWCGAICMQADSEIGQLVDVDLDNFETRVYDEQHELRGLLSGSHAQVLGAITHIDHCQLELYQKGQLGQEHDNSFLQPDSTGKIKIVLSSPSCDLNYATGEIKSAQPLEINLGNGSMLSGIGFDIDIHKFVIVIRSHVHGVFKLPKNSVKLP